MSVTLGYEERTEYLAEITSGKRIVVYDGEPYALSFPTQRDVIDGRIIYTQFFNTFRKLEPPVPTRMEARVTLTKAIADAGRDPEVIERRAAVLSDIGKKMQEHLPQERLGEYLQTPNGIMLIFNQFLDKLTDDERNVVMELQEQTRMEEEIMTNCAEAMAEEQRDLFLISRCLVDKDGKQVWDDYEKVMNEENIDKILFFRGQLALYWAGTPSQYEVIFEEHAEVVGELKKDTAPSS